MTTTRSHCSNSALCGGCGIVNNNTSGHLQFGVVDLGGGIEFDLVSDRRCRLEVLLESFDRSCGQDFHVISGAREVVRADPDIRCRCW